MFILLVDEVFVKELCMYIYLFFIFFLVIITYDSLAKFQFARRIMFKNLISYIEKKKENLMVIVNILI